VSRVLYLDCFSGISGNMFFGAMADLVPQVGLDVAAWRGALASLELEGVEVTLSEVHKRGIRALHGDVAIPHQHVHRGLHDVLAIVRRGRLTPGVLARTERIFTALAEAEASVHGTTVDDVHFHEVGAIDAIVDVVSAAFFLDALAPDEVVASPVRTGSGLVRCAHGDMPVPAPATALLLRGVPTYAGEVPGEFTTPTGAAILKASVSRYGPQPLMSVRAIGWGAGSREAPHPNCLRVLLGEAESAPAEGLVEERIAVLECHLDDMRGDELGFLVEQLLAGPAVDALVLPAVGKKGRPAQVLRVLCPVGQEGEVLALLFAGSTTLGARLRVERRVRLAREERTVQTPFGEVRVKITPEGRQRAEHDDVARLARAHGVALAAVREAAERGPA
jgi:pyridinium-3,5-bisthiocarboxylic acid mononucleotide nickel chelatase